MHGLYQCVLCLMSIFTVVCMHATHPFREREQLAPYYLILNCSLVLTFHSIASYSVPSHPCISVPMRFILFMCVYISMPLLLYLPFICQS